MAIDFRRSLRLPKGDHLGRNIGFRATAAGDHHAGIIDHTAPRGAFQKAKHVRQKPLRLEAGKTG